MLHGRVVRPRGQGPFGYGAPIVSVDETSIAHIPGAKVVRQGDFLGVVAPKEYDAIQAAAQLKVTWKESPMLPTAGNLFGQMRADDSGRPREGGVPHEHRQRRHRARLGGVEGLARATATTTAAAP